MPEERRHAPDNAPFQIFNGQHEETPDISPRLRAHMLWFLLLCISVSLTSFLWWGRGMSRQGTPAPLVHLPVNVPLLRMSEPVQTKDGFVQIVKIATWEDWHPLYVVHGEPLPKQFILRAKTARELPTIEILPEGGPGPQKD